MPTRLTVPESVLSDDLAARLPTATPAPPWPCRVEAVVWWHRSTAAARAALPVSLRDRARLPVTVGAFLRYLDSPVGPYSEVLACPLVLRGGMLRTSVAFIAVDSLASVAAGRQHWSLPKVLADFSGAAGRSAPRSAVGDGWVVTARPRPVGPAVPVAGRFSISQPADDGSPRTARSSLRGLARPALVQVEVESGLAADGPGTLAGWLRPGRHCGLVLEHCRLEVGAAGMARPSGMSDGCGQTPTAPD